MFRVKISGEIVPLVVDRGGTAYVELNAIKNLYKITGRFIDPDLCRKFDGAVYISLTGLVLMLEKEGVGYCAYWPLLCTVENVAEAASTAGGDRELLLRIADDVATVRRYVTVTV